MEGRIRPWRLDDAADLADAINNQKVQDNLRDGIPFPYTQRDASEYITAMLHADPDKVFAFAITVEDKAIGSIGVFRQENIHARTAQLGYYLAEPYWGRGYGTCAVRQVCRLVFDTTDILRIFAEPFAHNLPSCRVLEKAGFSLEGVMRKNAEKNGSVFDMKLYALVKEDVL